MSEPAFHVVLVEPEIPPNTGNVARLCAAAGARLHLVGPLGFRMDDASMRRAGMDYWDLVDWSYHATLGDALAGRGPGASVYCVETCGETSHWDASFKRGDHLVFGRETRGLKASDIEVAGGRCLRIPVPNPKARSINLANCVAIVLYEALRQVR